MTPEGIVVEAVERYFSQPKFRKFSIKTEDRIQFGSRHGFADVVLLNNGDGRVAIVECKRDGVEGHGIEQLQSYLNATNTPLGIFANSTEPDSWSFYENRRDRLKEITRTDFERRVVKRKNNLITRASDSFRSLFSAKSNDETKSTSDDEDPAEMETNGELVEPISSVKSPPANINYVIKDVPLRNKSSRENTVEPSSNGTPYYSEENGFYWAANHQGIAECVPQHIKRIIHNEELEIASTDQKLEEEINCLGEKVVELEAQKREYEEEIENRTEELAEKKEDLAGLEVQLKALAINRLAPPPAEGIPDDSNPELFNTAPPEAVPDSPLTKQFEEEINDLLHEKADIEDAIAEKNQVLAEKKEKLAGLEIESQGPTETELKPTVADSSVEDAPSAKHRFPKINFITAILATFFFILLAAYLFIFYASAVDKAFFLNTEAIQAQLAQGTYAGVNDVVNPKALSKAFQGEWNLFVLMFPFVFLAFAIALDYFWEQGKWMYLVAILLAALTLIFDAILAVQISQKIHQAKILMGQETEQWSFRINDLNMWTVIFCGFVVSMLVSIIYHVMNQRWKAVSPPQEKTTASDLHALKIESEKKQREASIAVLQTEMDNLQSRISEYKEKESAIQEKITRTVKTPLETQAAVLKVEMENLQDEINQFNNRNTVIQQNIKIRNTHIADLSSRRNKRVVDGNKLESQINQFLNGWCRFVAHSGNGPSDVSDQINDIKDAAKNTLDNYYNGAPDPAAQP